MISSNHRRNRRPHRPATDSEPRQRRRTLRRRAERQARRRACREPQHPGEGTEPGAAREKDGRGTRSGTTRPPPGSNYSCAPNPNQGKSTRHERDETQDDGIPGRADTDEPTTAHHRRDRAQHSGPVTDERGLAHAQHVVLARAGPAERHRSDGRENPRPTAGPARTVGPARRTKGTRRAGTPGSREPAANMDGNARPSGDRGKLEGSARARSHGDEDTRIRPVRTAEATRLPRSMDPTTVVGMAAAEHDDKTRARAMGRVA